MTWLNKIGQTENGKLAMFLALALLLAWLVWVPAMLVSYDLPGFQLPLFGLVGAMGPGISAFILAALFEGRAGVRDLLRRLAIWRVGLRWYSVALFLPPLIVLTTYFAYSALTGQILPGPTMMGYTIVIIMLVQVPNTLLEEIGWRGYAYPRLMPGRNLILMTVLFGMYHIFWHLPYWLTSSLTQEYGLPYFSLASFIVLALTMTMTWLWVNTRASVLLAWILHLSMNTTSAYLPLSPDVTGSLGPMVLQVSLMVLVALGATISMNRRRVRALTGSLPSRA